MQAILGDLGPGALLPSEAQLADDHGVSRLTVREAIKLLAGRGVLDVGRGRRAKVLAPSGAVFGSFLVAAMMHDPKGIFELLELRQALEVQSASAAARRANRAAIEAVESALRLMRESAAAFHHEAAGEQARREFCDADVQYHEALALCSGNRLLSYFLEAMAAPLRQSFELSLAGRELGGGHPDEIIAAHERILERVRSGDSRRAAQEMRAHLRDAERDLRKAISHRSTADRK